MRSALSLLATCLFCAAVAQAAESWQVRYAMLPDQTEEWTKLGRVPGWKVELSPEDRKSVV